MAATAAGWLKDETIQMGFMVCVMGISFLLEMFSLVQCIAMTYIYLRVDSAKLLRFELLRGSLKLYSERSTDELSDPM